MANCVNRSLQEFKDLEKLTQIHPTILAAKIAVWQDVNNTEAFPKASELSIETAVKPEEEQLLMERDFRGNPFSPENQERRKSDFFIEEFVRRLQNNLGMTEEQVQHVTRKEAEIITQDAVNPIFNQPAFYYNGVVYLVKGEVNFKTALHEFAHPLVRAISIDNTKLFNKIYSDITSVPQGQTFLSEALAENPGLDAKHDQIKEEVIVKAMTYVAFNKNSTDLEVQPSNIIMQAIEKLIYALKQAFRKLGTKKINPKNLNVNTDVKQLADMLIDESWGINMDIIPESDIVAYMGEREDAQQELNEILNEGEGIAAGYKIIDENASTYMNQLNDMERDEKYSDILEVTEYDDAQTFTERAQTNLVGQALGSRIKKANKRAKRLESAKTDAEKAKIIMENEREEVNELRERNRLLYENLVLFDHETRAITQHAKLLADEPDQQAAFAKIPVYIRHLKSSRSFLSNFDKELQNLGAAPQTQIRKDINTIIRDIDDAETAIDQIVRNAMSKSLNEVNNRGYSTGVTKINEEIAKKRKKIEKNPRDADLLGKQIADLEEERSKMLTTPDIMLDYLEGRAGDISFASQQLENFISSQDKSISSFWKYMKDNKTKVGVVINKGKNDLLHEINKYLPNLKVGPKDLAAFKDQFVFEDITTRKNKDTGELEKYTVKTLLNPTQNQKYDLGMLFDARKKAVKEWQDNPSDQNFNTLSDIAALYEKHKNYYFQRENIDEYYEADNELLAATWDIKDKDGKVTETINIGQLAREEASEAFQEVIQLQNAEPDADVETNANFESVDRLMLEYKKLFSLYNDNGKKKTGIALRKAELLIQNRDKKRKYHEYKPIRNAFEKALKGAEAKFRVELEELDLEDTAFEEELEKKVQAWINENTRSKNKDSFYAMRSNIYDDIKTIMSKVGQTEDISEERQKLIDLLIGRKDDNGEPVAPEMTEELLADIKALEEEIIEAQKGRAKLKDLGLTDAQVSLLGKLFNQLQQLQVTQATSYYIEQADAFYRKIKKAEGETNPETFNLENIDKFSRPSFIAELRGKDADFDAWFDKNHILKEKYFAEGKQQVYERTKAWSIVKPREAKYIETTEIFDENGIISRTIEGVPKMKYFRRHVKDEYITGYNPSTKKITPNAHFDIQGFALPKSLKDMDKFHAKNQELLAEHNNKVEKIIGESIKWDRYINRDYLNLKKKDDDQYKLLEVLRDFHFKSQVGLDKNKTLGNEMPRIRRDTYQYLKTGNAAADARERADMLKKGALQIFGKKADDYEQGVNYAEQERLVGAEAYAAQEGTRVPIEGKYNLDLDQTSDDVIGTIFTYYQSAEMNKMLTKELPMAQGMKDLAEKNDPTLFKTVKKMMVNGVEQSNVRVPIGVDTKNNRRKHLIDGMVEIMFEGKSLKESNNNPTGVKVVNTALGIAAHSFFALDMTSALKNFYGAQFQIALEAAGSKYYSYKSWQLGRPWAFKAMAKISKEIYNEEAKSLEIQLIDIMDAVQGRREEKFGESPSRSLMRDVASLSWLTSHRKWLETEATLQIFSAIMHDTIVEQDGKPIKYIDAFELDEQGTIKLKDGIDEEWAPGGQKFLDTVNHNHETSNFLQGMYAQSDKPLINRAIAWRMFGSLKNYFTKMFLHRYAAKGLSLKDPSSWFNPQSRTNLGTGQMHMGFYWQNVLTAKKMVEHGLKYAMYLNPEEKRAAILGALEILKVQLFALAAYLLMASFGTDPDDEKRWSKMQKQTGALPTPLTNEKWAKNFELSGWARAHLLLLIMSVETEANAFIPTPGYGMNHMYNTVAGQSSIAMGASFEAIKDMMGDLYFTVTGDDRVTYKRDTGGLKTKQAGTNKFLHKLMRMSGVSGKFIDPITTAKNIEAARKSNKS